MQVWVRDLASGRLIATAKLNGNAAPYFANSKLEEGRAKRGKAALKRIDIKRADVELEMNGERTITITPEAAAAREALQIEMSVTSISPAPLPEPANIRPVFGLPPTQRGKYQYWCRIDAKIRADEEISADDRRFHGGFQTTAAWKTERMLDPELQLAQDAT